MNTETPLSEKAQTCLQRQSYDTLGRPERLHAGMTTALNRLRVEIEITVRNTSRETHVSTCDLIVPEQ